MRRAHQGRSGPQMVQTQANTNRGRQHIPRSTPARQQGSANTSAHPHSPSAPRRLPGLATNGKSPPVPRRSTMNANASAASQGPAGPSVPHDVPSRRPSIHELLELARQRNATTPCRTPGSGRPSVGSGTSEFSEFDHHLGGGSRVGQEIEVTVVLQNLDRKQTTVTPRSKVQSLTKKCAALIGLNTDL